MVEDGWMELFSVVEQQCFLSVVCYLFNQHLHMNNSCSLYFYCGLKSCLEDQKPSLMEKYLYIIYSLLASIFIDYSDTRNYCVK